MTLLSAKATQAGDKLIELEFEFDAHRGIAAKAENLSLLESSCAEVLGYPVNVRVAMTRKCDAASKASSASAEKLVSAVEELAEKLGTRVDVIDE